MASQRHPRHDMLFLSAGDVERIQLGVPEVVALVERALREHAEGQTENPPKIGVHPRPDTFIHAMPAYLKESGLAGMKCVAGYPTNPARGLPHVLGILLLQEPDTGLPYALMECGWVTAARTAAATALIVRECAPPGARTLGLLGTGVQGRAIVPAVRYTNPGLTRMVVYNRSRPALDRLLGEMRESSPEVEVVVAAEPRQAVEAADVVIEATGPVASPLTRNEWFRPEALLVAVGYGFGRETMRIADRVVTTDAKQMEHMLAQARSSRGARADARSVIHAELGDVLVGRAAGRTAAAERVFGFVTGIALFDLVVGHAVYEMARKAGLGRRLDLLS